MYFFHGMQFYSIFIGSRLRIQHKMFSMNIRIGILFTVQLLSIAAYSQGPKTYTLLFKKNGKLNVKLIESLPPSLKGMAALYSAMGGTNCVDQQCELTTALGLGNQGSEAQKALIQKYFPNDKAAKLVLSQECYLPPTSSPSFSNFVSLAFIVNGDQVTVNYELDVLNHGVVKKIKGPDLYAFKNGVFKNTKRVLYAWTSKP
jgi:hypothetical protein